MSRSLTILSTVLAIGLFAGSGASAQTVKAASGTKTAAPAKGDQSHAAAGELPGGASSLQESYGDWTVNCALPNGQKVCTFSQTQTKQDTNQRVLTAELTLGPDGAIVGVLVLPFGLALANGVTLAIDDGEPGPALPFQTCLPAGCLVQLKFGADKIADLGRAKQLKITATAADTGQALPFTLSLRGFTQAAARTKALVG
ncbi:invasion associated locus B family protein [Segnochrobactrum spirostomi]|uniref:Invasion associated locus B family protein n=1 Tax=Segnochrobactrum spirostomi TaxID=2608987 RepID=A0A6A7Y949_9HYPH|nr:invasion associated locus B family protein [Segnochrobactrum spirostomi]MQT14518.1 invasion associated locus B family protein [Segnochrobactrum spirostomi]